jgi:tetratricopeptide (TPR) repeat protein
MVSQNILLGVKGGADIHNDVVGSVTGSLIQSGIITGGVHVHPTQRTLVVPRQLPAPPRLFTGRVSELATLTAAMDAQDDPGAMMVISAIGGAGGIGKTWLVLHWAYQHLDRFPDGQLHVDLRGFDSTGTPTPPAVALRGFLDALGVDPAAIPVNFDAQIGLYRSLIASRRMLIVLDNAADTAHVAPLLPGSPTCTVLVTSRRSLTGLVTAYGAQPLNLDVLTEAEARELLARHIGDERLAEEPTAAADLLRCCAGLPLALNIVAARAASHSDFPLTVFADELRDHAARLDGLDTGDTNLNLRAVFSWSYDALRTEVASVFGLLGLVLGPDISLHAVASLATLPSEKATVLLRELENGYLVTQRMPSRYQMHDLVRLYAAECVAPDARTPALRRLMDFYTHTAYAGDRLLYPHRQPIDLASPAIGVRPYPLQDEAAALVWFDAEWPCLRAIQMQAADHGWHDVVWQLAWALHTYYLRRGHLHEQVAAWRLGLRAAEQVDDAAILALAHRRLGQACTRVNEHAEAMSHIQEALRLAKAAGDELGQAHTHLALMRAWEQRRYNEHALTHALHALRLYRNRGAPVWEAEALNAVGWFEAQLGHHAEAEAHCRLALQVFDEHQYIEGAANSMDGLGYIAQHTGRPTQALTYYHQALKWYRVIGHAYFEANALDRLGQALLAVDQHGRAEDAWCQALELYQTQHRTVDVDRIQQQMTALDQHTR